MKDNRFIELVNLYIDRQITANEAADLEAEMQANPGRRAIYREYCKMHRATTLVYESFRTDAGAQESKQGASRASIAPFETPHRKRRAHWSYYAGGLVAACIAIVFVSRNSSVQIDNGSVTAFSLKPPAASVAVIAAPAVAKATVATPVVIASTPRVTAPAPAAEKDYAAMLTSLRREEQRAFANGQIQSSHLSSLFEDGVFDSRQELSGSSQRIFRAKQAATQQTAEFTAFQFQR
jgi:hypothetical protein